MDTLIHSLRDITIRRISVSEMDNNVYLLTAKESGAQLLIDAADDLPAIQGLLADAAEDTAATPKLALIATTHQHWDHVRALPALVGPPAPGRPPVRTTHRSFPCRWMCCWTTATSATSTAST